ncbi:hypothetical protein [Rhizobacter sp. Root1221]|uniref:hypothetical protein n=1 Tax=Rhizobacter sp. Root1221 TaxID=1736433 RepID=UPI0006F56952|nr:hypothetical protein [Rhizobacter sp. Root1221]KQV99979.1 hypothetical protein ASC87_19965 [Rhizobacter sp. Root1221]
MNLINKDKLYHLIAGFLITVAGYAVLAVAGVPSPNALCLALALTAVFAFMKEAYDQAHPEAHTTDVLDAMVTLCGAALAGITINLLELSGVL